MPAPGGTSAPKGRVSREVKQARSGDLKGAVIGLATKPHLPERRVLAYPKKGLFPSKYRVSSRGLQLHLMQLEVQAFLG